MREPIPSAIAGLLRGARLEGFPEEPPWQADRPRWATDAGSEDRERLIGWLSWFYGLEAAGISPDVPLPPRYQFIAAGQTLRIGVRDGVARFEPYPSSNIRVSDLRAFAGVLTTWKRRPVRMAVDDDGKTRWIEVEAWTRPEFITLALGLRRNDVERKSRQGYIPGSRGTDETSGLFGVIPIDFDFAEGEHAPLPGGLRRPRRDEREEIFGRSNLPWSYEIEGVGGAYRYLKLERPVDYEDDPILSREILHAAQRELIDVAASAGISIDLAFKGGTSLCRVPYSIQTKYAWKSGPRVPLPCPETNAGPSVGLDQLEPLREKVRSRRTRRLVEAHQSRLKRLGTAVPEPVAAHLEVRCKERPYGRLFLLRHCPMCGKGPFKAHIAELNWKLKCKRESCRASRPLGHEEWLPGLEPTARKELRAYIVRETALQRLADHPPLTLNTEPAFVVKDASAGVEIIRRELIRHHQDAPAQEGGGVGLRLLLLGADCGAGKTWAANVVSQDIPVVFTALQYSLLDEYHGNDPYQIQGLRKGCQIPDLGDVAAARGVSRSYLCSARDDQCQLMPTCPAQPRIESGRTPTCVHPAIPTVAFGAVVKDGEILSDDEVGAQIGRGRLLIIDEIPDLFDEKACTEADVREVYRFDNLRNGESLVRGGQYTEADDARTRMLFLWHLCHRLRELMGAEMLQGGDDYACTWSASRVAECVRRIASELSSQPGWDGVYELFRIGNVIDPAAFSGERPCIPSQREWTTYSIPLQRRSPEHVKTLVPESVIHVCRATSAALDSGGAGTRLAATLDNDVTLKALTPRSLALPGTTGTAILSAGIALHARLLPALYPRAEIRLLSVQLAEGSRTFRTLLVTSAFTRTSVLRAFGEERYAGVGKRVGVSKADRKRNARARKDYLGSLKRALQVASDAVRREVDAGVMSPGTYKTLLVAHGEAVDWFVNTEGGKKWLDENVPSNLHVEVGDPWSGNPAEWGTLVYWGGRGKGENLWADCRVAVTVGDHLPNIGDMEARWGDRIDSRTGEPFDAAEVAVWFAQEAAMQALERTRPKRPELPTVLVHAGRYKPMGFGEDAEIILAEESRSRARRALTAERVALALEDEKDRMGGALRPGSVAGIARAAGVDRKTAAQHLNHELLGIKALIPGRATSRVSPMINILIGEIPELARALEGAFGGIRSVLQTGATLPKAATAVRILERLGHSPIPALRTLQGHLAALRRDLRGSGFHLPRRSDALAARVAAIVASLEHLGLLESVRQGAELASGDGDEEDQVP